MKHTQLTHTHVLSIYRRSGLHTGWLAAGYTQNQKTGIFVAHAHKNEKLMWGEIVIANFGPPVRNGQTAILNFFLPLHNYTVQRANLL